MINAPRKVDSMPRYFFDLDGGERLFRDEKGRDLPDVQAACEEAIAVLPDIVRAMVTGRDGKTLTSTVRDEVGNVVFGVRLTLLGH